MRGRRLVQSSFADLLLLLLSLLLSFFLVVHSPVCFDHPSVLIRFVSRMCVACSTIIHIRIIYLLVTCRFFRSVSLKSPCRSCQFGLSDPSPTATVLTSIALGSLWGVQCIDFPAAAVLTCSEVAVATG